MTSKNTLNAKNLEALGAERLAELLIEISTGNTAAKQRLRLALAGAQSPGEVAKEVRKRLTTVARLAPFPPRDCIGGVTVAWPCRWRRVGSQINDNVLFSPAYTDAP